MQLLLNLKAVLICCVSLVGFMNRGGEAPSYQAKQDAEKKAIETVLALTEVKRMDKIIDSISRHKRGISILVIDRPKNKKTGFYILQAGHNGEERFELIYTFHVFLPDYKTMYDDPVTGGLITLEEWRKSRSRQ